MLLLYIKGQRVALKLGVTPLGMRHTFRYYLFRIICFRCVFIILLCIATLHVLLFKRSFAAVVFQGDLLKVLVFFYYFYLFSKLSVDMS